MNKLDEAALEHDIFYGEHKDRKTRQIGDKILQKKAWKRVLSSDATLGERTAALLTSGAMKIKRTLGMGLKTVKKRKVTTAKKQNCRIIKTKTKTKKNKNKNKNKQPPAFKKLVGKVNKSIKKVGNRIDMPSAIALALNIILHEVFFMKKCGKKIKNPSKIMIPKSGGALPIVPIVAGMSLLSGAATSVASIAKAIENIISARKAIRGGQSNEKQIGNGLYLAPYADGKKKNGHSLYLTTSPLSHQLKN